MAPDPEAGVDVLVAAALAASADALAASDDDAYDAYDAYDEAVHELQRRGTEAVFEAMVALLTAPGAFERRLAADVLGQLGFVLGRPFLERAWPLLESRSIAERDPGVLASVVIALGGQEDARVIPAVVRHRAHADPDVRQAVAIALHPIGPSSDELADAGVVPALAALMQDPEPCVRDWATFSLAQLDLDDHEIRAALVARLDDPDETVRAEAIGGLARRHDRRAVDPLIAMIDDTVTADDVDARLLEAATALGSDRLLAPLRALARRSAPGDALHAAIGWCDPDEQRRHLALLTELLDGVERAAVPGVSLSEVRFPLGDRFVELNTGPDTSYDVSALLARAGGSVAGAAHLVRADHAASPAERPAPDAPDAPDAPTR